jgi:hypothetical protein
MRHNGITVHDTPTQFDHNSTHSIHDATSNIRIPLLLRGAVSYFDTHTPTLSDLTDIPRIELTSPSDWSTSALHIAEQEATHTVTTCAFHTSNTDIINEAWAPTTEKVAITILASSSDLVETVDDESLYQRLIATVNVFPHNPLDLDNDIPSDYPQLFLSSLTTTERRSAITPDVLAQRWGISIPAAAATLQSITQEGVRNVYIPAERKPGKRHHGSNSQRLKGSFMSTKCFPN